MSNLIPLAIAVVSAGALAWPKLQGLFGSFKSDPNQPPHTEMSRVIDFFRQREHQPGLDSAMSTGKFIYDALIQKSKGN